MLSVEAIEATLYGNLQQRSNILIRSASYKSSKYRTLSILRSASLFLRLCQFVLFALRIPLSLSASHLPFCVFYSSWLLIRDASRESNDNCKCLEYRDGPRVKTDIGTCATLTSSACLGNNDDLERPYQWTYQWKYEWTYQRKYQWTYQWKYQWAHTSLVS